MKKFQAQLQTFSGAMMVPVILFVLVGFYVGVGAGITNYIIKEGPINEIFSLVVGLGFMFMRNLPLWFAVGIAFGLAKKEKGWAAFAGVVMLFSILATIQSWASMRGFTPDTTSVEALLKSGMAKEAAENFNALWGKTIGFFGYDMGIFSGILAGVMAAFIHNKFVDTEFSPMFAFFGGTKFVIIMTTLVAIPYAILIYTVWPAIGTGLQNLTHLIASTGLFGTFLFGTVDKMLLPFGIHHLIAFPIEYSKVGGTMMIDGVMHEGVRNIINAQAASKEATGYIVHNFTTGRILFQLAGLPGAAYAMYKVANPDNRKRVASLLVPAVMTLALVGISEPIEYTFLFVSPALYYLLYAPLCGLCYVLAEVTNVSINGHALFFMIPNLFQPHKVQAMSLIWLLPATFAMYYFAFKFAIEKFNIQTPGRGESDIKLMSKKEYKAIQAEKDGVEISLEEKIIAALGGAKNINNITCCATRLRVELKDDSIIAPDDEWKARLQAIEVVRLPGAVQVIYGTKVTGILTRIKDLLGID